MCQIYSLSLSLSLLAGALRAIGNNKGGASRGELKHPVGIALQIETREGFPQLYVADCAMNVIQVYSLLYIALF